jgi:hypothetical protein
MTNTNVYRESLNTFRKSYSFECYEGAKRVFKMRMPYKKWCEKSNEQIIHGELLDIHILDGVKIIVCKEYNTEKQYD